MFGYSVKSLGSINRFFKYRNDIDIFTEDNLEDKEFYRVLFQRLLSNSIKINDITPLGCKTNVLEKYDLLKNDNSRRRLFIVDGDLELINNANRSDNNSLFVLKSYCIENYLIEESASAELVYLNNQVEICIIKERLAFNAWLEEIQFPLINLFINFAILRKIGGGPKLLNAHSFLISSGNVAKLDIAEINKYADTVMSEIILKLEEQNHVNPQQYYNDEKQTLFTKWGNNTSTLLTIVSGKNYLLPALNFHLKSCIDGGSQLFKTKSLKMALAKFCNIERLNDLKYHIEN